MKNGSGWRYAAAGLCIASIAAVVSYNDGLFVARLAGNHDHQAYLYPLLPDGLIVVCLLALVEGARMKPAQRSGWATCGLVLGIGLTLAMNVGAGYAHSLLDAFLDGMVPVVFFIAVEVVLWHVRRSRADVAGEDVLQGAYSSSPATHTGTVPSSPYEAAKARMREAAERGFKYSNEQAAGEWSLSRAQTAKARQEVTDEECIPATATGTRSPGRAPHPAISPAPDLIVVEDEVNAAMRAARAAADAPAGDPPAPAGALPASNGAHG